MPFFCCLFVTICVFLLQNSSKTRIMNIQDLKDSFKKLYGREAENAYFAPGRVNLIGEHTDYNGGLVFPCALGFGTYLLVARRNDKQNNLHSLNMEFSTLTDASALNLHPTEWIKYPLGVMKEFADRNFDVWGYDMLYFGNVPIGSALSSSASIEVVTAVMLDDVCHANLGMLELVKMSQSAECNFVGVKCGIMDQFASGFGKKNHAIALDCATLEYTHVPLNIDGYKLVIINTNKKRGLVDSKYNDRRRECEEAAAILAQKYPIQFLCQLTEEQFYAADAMLTDETLHQRAEHAVTENARVLKAINALKAGQLDEFGKLMNASHQSLKDHYAVSCFELDTLAENAQQYEGVIGSRMTGGGFGGCTVTLIKEEKVEPFIAHMAPLYKEKTGLEASFYIADIGDGAKKLF